MLQRVKTAVLLVLVYSAVTYLGMRVMMVPSVSGLCLGALFALTFGLLFGRLGAFSAGIGAVIGCSFGGLHTMLLPIHFLAVFLSSYVPFRIWQGMRSENEPVLLVYDQRTRMMALVLSLASSAPLGLTLAFAGDLFQIIPFELTYFPIMLPALGLSILGGQTVLSWSGRYFCRGGGIKWWEAVRDDKWTSHLLSVALLRISLTALAVGEGFCLIFPPQLGEPVVLYVSGGLAAVLLILSGM